MNNQSAFDKVLGYIAENSLSDGDTLPPERTLAEELGLSRRELRAVLGSLEVAGRIWRGVGRGTFLGARPLKFAPSLSGLSAGTSPTDVAEMRLLVEPALAALAAMKASPDDLAELDKCARRNAGAKDDDEWQHWDHRFHYLIARATRNPAIISLLEAINGVRVKPALREKTVDQKTRDRFAAEHLAVVEAMLSRDGEAAFRAMRNHLLNVQDRLHEK